MIKIGVIGTGNMGKNHVRILSEERTNFKLAAIYDANAETAASFSRKYRVKAAESVDELLDSVDAAVIAVPSSLHYEIALKAAAKGVNALVEKPLTLDFDDAQRIDEAFRSAGKVLMVGHVERYNPVVMELQNILCNEKMVAVDIHRCSPYSPRISDADVISDLMIHDIDILCNGLGCGTIRRLSAQGNIVVSGDKLDYVQALIEFENGVMGSITASRITEDKIRTLDVHAKNGFIHADLLTHNLQISRRTSYTHEPNQTQLYKQESIVEKVMVPSFEPLRKELLTFADCIQNGAEPVTGGKPSAYAIRVASAIREAALKGKG